MLTLGWNCVKMRLGSGVRVEVGVFVLLSLVSGAECFGQGGAARRDAAAARPVAAAGARGDAGGSGVALSSVEEPCPRPAVGAVVEQPEDLRSKDGVLRVELVVRSHREADGTMRFCYVLGDGRQSPTLRVAPGDLLVLSLKNELSVADGWRRCQWLVALVWRTARPPALLRVRRLRRQATRMFMRMEIQKRTMGIPARTRRCR